MSFKNNSWRHASMYTATVNAFKDNISIAVSDVPSDFDTRKKIKYGNTTQAAWGIFSEYCNNSTIHGIKYLGEQKRPLMERLFWIFVFVLSIYACSRLTLNVWNKWDQNPVIVSFAEKSTPVWQIPFPAVTICPEIKAKNTIFNFTEMFYAVDRGEQNESSADDLFYMEAISQVCDYHLTKDFNFGNKIVNESIIRALEQASPTFNETYMFCKWRNQLGLCDDLFEKILTEEGICHSFNSLDPSEIFRNESIHDDYIFQINYRKKADWDLEDGFSKDAGTITYPERVLSAGTRAGLFLLVQGHAENFDYLCRGPVQGFKILLHTPGEVAQVSRQYFRIPFGQEVLVSIKPNIITTSEGLRHYPPSRRQCFFQKERYLRYFQVYTQSNCELECLANYTLNKCGCVKFSMPRNKDTPICGAASLACYDDAEDSLLKAEFEEGLLKAGSNLRGETECNCLPACTSIAYDAEISQADFDFKKLFESYGEDEYFDKYPGAKMARLSIFFKENQFLTSKRSELYGTTDLLANVGGLLGLFMGVSTLSLVELIYFCTVRLISNLQMRKERLKKLELSNVTSDVPEIFIRKPCQQSDKSD